MGGLPFDQFLAMRVTVREVVLFACLMLGWHVILALLGLYHSKRLSPRREELIDLIQAASVATLFLLMAGLISRASLITPGFVALFWLISMATLLASHIALRMFLSWVRLKGRNLRNMVIVGTNGRAIEFAHRIEKNPEMGYRVIGFVDESWDGLEEFSRSNYQLLSDLDGFLELLRQSVVDEVVLALPMKSQYEQSAHLAALCEEQGIPVRVLSSIVDLKRTEFKVEDHLGDSLVTSPGAWEGWPLAAKRVMDVAFSLVTLILVSPIAIAAAIAIKLTSPGPVLFGQQRLGVNKRRFTIYKFRTMVPDAEKRMKDIEHLNEAGGPTFKIKHDPRITPIGRILRRTSIDELPQLLNVLKGDMSLVGPRPLPVRDYEGFNKDWQRRRFSVRPGITCLWQVMGRSSITFEQWMELDMEYVDTWSLWLDLEILLRTIPAVLKGSGAA
jgi:exopolysaccharide biosynthesis polyprenyl glycosylphosphotransferase